ncbi:hypothetical protein XA68_17784 [Ophiocordyceps unilateralis]|uniref:Uncharacterized protein n=1 Tax=Ophiocordyceps unilateralis TaxID=268505 RepID=A0A2A9PRY6_OPHUN|nr:hypothetical protein XA68_17784 [Ophiocordyceps unilateralis]
MHTPNKGGWNKRHLYLLPAAVPNSGTPAAPVLLPAKSHPTHHLRSLLPSPFAPAPALHPPPSCYHPSLPLSPLSLSLSLTHAHTHTHTHTHALFPLSSLQRCFSSYPSSGRRPVVSSVGENKPFLHSCSSPLFSLLRRNHRPPPLLPSPRAIAALAPACGGPPPSTTAFPLPNGGSRRTSRRARRSLPPTIRRPALAIVLANDTDASPSFYIPVRNKTTPHLASRIPRYPAP